MSKCTDNEPPRAPLGHRAVKTPTTNNIDGPIVPVMPAFDAHEKLDLTSTCKWVDWQIASGIKIFWTTYGTSHYMSLTDDEINALNQAVANVTRGRAVLIASTNFGWSVGKCLEFIHEAREWGVDYVKVQVDWRWNPNPDAVFDYYRRIARDTTLPLFAYTLAAPNVKGMNRGLLTRIMKLPRFVGLKNDSGDFYEQCDYLREVRRASRSFNVITGGSMASFMHNHQFGARAFATGVGIVFPQVALRFHAALLAGRQAECVTIIQDCEEPFNDLYAQVSVSHWACFHTILMELGLFHSDRLRFPLLTAKPAERKIIRKLMKLPALNA
jgi:dihydrodipicolinate synthase/N-acetylneuraminate lyase|uniref:dihydrodipicolinate synthase family protein n=1 Tax=Cephaloticoccus sp. TaxID=1985742 RepID=UPI00404A814A